MQSSTPLHNRLLALQKLLKLSIIQQKTVSCQGERPLPSRKIHSKLLSPEYSHYTLRNDFIQLILYYACCTFLLQLRDQVTDNLFVQHHFEIIPSRIRKA